MWFNFYSASYKSMSQVGLANIKSIRQASEEKSVEVAKTGVNVFQPDTLVLRTLDGKKFSFSYVDGAGISFKRFSGIEEFANWLSTYGVFHKVKESHGKSTIILEREAAVSLNPLKAELENSPWTVRDLKSGSLIMPGKWIPRRPTLESDTLLFEGCNYLVVKEASGSHRYISKRTGFRYPNGDERVERSNLYLEYMSQYTKVNNRRRSSLYVPSKVVKRFLVGTPVQK